LTRLWTHALIAFLGVAALHAQDTRTVVEPRFPVACTTLTANLAAPGGVLSDAAEKQPDTARIQAAIDGCGAAKAVELKGSGAKNVFLIGPITLKSGVTLLVDAHTAVFASRNPRDYDVAPGSCGVVAAKRGPGCKSLITVNNAPNSGIMGDGSIDGRGGAMLTGQKESWWELAKRAKVYDQSQSVTRLISVNHSDNFTLYRITLRNSPNFHVSVAQSDGFTAWGVNIVTPKTARNTDGIDPSSSKNVTITHCYITTGDDNVAIKSGTAGPATNMTIADNHFYSGHGMSIGSNTNGGVNHIKVSNLTLEGTDNGIRIKSDRSRGGLVENVTYENVCMKEVANPIVLNSKYTIFPGDLIPVYRDIVLKDVRSVTPGYNTIFGVDAEHKVRVQFDNVTIAGLTPKYMAAEHANVQIGPGGSNVLPTGEGVTVHKVQSAETNALSCSERFVPFPKLPTAPEAKVRIPEEDPTLYVAADGTGDYYSIQRAIDVAPEKGAVISIAPGTYREVLTIDKPHIHLRSPYEDASKTVVVMDRSAGAHGGTMNSATVNVHADDFLAENLTFQNDFNAHHEQTSQGSQALAVHVTGDRVVFRNMRLLGNQDTVYAGSNGGAPTRQYFDHCYIEGNVDFIFGDAKAFFDHCEIKSTPHQGGYITAQGKHAADQDSAYVFDHCKLTAYPGVDHIWLGRPWRPYATVVFLNTEMGPHIEPAGWREWHPGETTYMETVFYAEYNSTGPGAHASERDSHTRKLTASDAAKFDMAHLFAGWKP
jgi:polygalacturonase